jgi:hypothetical protein
MIFFLVFSVPADERLNKSFLIILPCPIGTYTNFEVDSVVK